MAVRDAAAMIPVADIDAAIAFMQDSLGFETTLRTDRHAYCARGGGAVRPINAPPDADMDDPARQLVIYIDVDDVEAEFVAHRTALEALPRSHFRPPFNQVNGQRESLIIHEHVAIVAGQPMPKEDTD